jgi:hypothetical protein
MQKVIKKFEKSLPINMWITIMRWPCLAFFAFFILGAASIHADEKPTIINESTKDIFHDLQEAIILATPGDTLKISGKCIGNFTIFKSLTLVGHHAVLDGGNKGTVLTTLTPTGELVDVTIVLENLTIQNGLGLFLGGGGILNIGANVIIKNAQIINNSAPFGMGGGIANVTVTMPSTMLIEGAKISHNTGLTGGGIANSLAFMEIKHSQITSNIAEEAGGGIFSFAGSNAITNTAIAYNVALLQGGGIENIADSQTALKHVKLIDNSAGQGAGIYSGSMFFGGSFLAIDDTEFKGNNTQSFGGGLYNDAGSTAVFDDSRVIKNSAILGGGGIFNNRVAVLFINKTEISKNLPDNVLYFNLPAAL